MDIDILREINLNRNTKFDRTFQFLSNSTKPIVIITPIALYSSGYLMKNEKLKRKSIFVATSIAIDAIFTTAVKYNINRTRPFITYPDLDKKSDGGSPSFPSGHTSNSFALATSLSIAFPKWYVIAPSFVWAGLVAYSRMDLGVHYPSDVLAGMIIGIGVTYLNYKIGSKYFNR
ncbi:MAG: phosphatase PAP2 family protein [Saprospiraceae bacterium]